ncbi:Shr3 amino acid permease chaperone [Coprinopsis sp. MPI-PUGE-AT-0042]|nr:Shr3 amino acid permease chaperone [Coprinopsis sp. MPI-PUGE-AT-0042]
MGIRAGVATSITSFLLGALFVHWVADSLTLWKSPVTDEHLWTAANYYSVLTKCTPGPLYFLAFVVALGGSIFLWSLNDLEAENIMFDGGSIFLFATVIYVNLQSVIPNIFTNFTTLPVQDLTQPFPPQLRNQTLELASNNLICSVALTGVLALQAGRLWAEREGALDNDDDYVLVDSKDASAAPSTSPSKSEKREHDVKLPIRVETN